MIKKLLVAAAGLFIIAAPALAASDLGAMQQTIGVGKTLSVGLNTSPTGSWFVVYNSSSAVASASIVSGSLIVKGLAAGSANISVCTDNQGTSCMSVAVMVTGSVLGATTTATAAHAVGSWVLDHGTVYYIASNGIIPITTWKIFLNNGGTQSKIVPANAGDLSLPVLALMTSKDSRVAH